MLACAAATEPARMSVAERVVEKVGAWKVSLRRMRWCTIWYLWRKSSVLCDGSGNKDGFEVDLIWSVKLQYPVLQDSLVKMLLGEIVYHLWLLKGSHNLQPVSWILQMLIFVFVVLHF